MITISCRSKYYSKSSLLAKDTGGHFTLRLLQRPQRTREFQSSSQQLESISFNAQ